MKYSYELTYSNGEKAFTIQDQLFEEEKVLETFKTNGVKTVKFHRHIPMGYQLCGCGNLAKGNGDELCDECRETYGHYYEHEL